MHGEAKLCIETRDSGPHSAQSEGNWRALRKLRAEEKEGNAKMDI